MILSLDTNVLIDIVNDRKGVRARYDEAVLRGDKIVTSSVAAHEFYFGGLISRRPEHHLARARTLLADMQVVDWSFDDGVSTAGLRRSLRETGTPIGGYDVMIAGQAMARG